MKPVVLSGFMGTGKSTAGPRIAARLGVPFVDTDAEIERAAGERIADLWRRDGEAAFRAREAALIGELLASGVARVIAVGGGALVAPALRRRAIDAALVVTLSASPEALLARMPNLATRPSLAGPDPLARAKELLALRAPAYAECHLSLPTEATDANGLADAVARAVARDPLLVPLGERSYTIDVCVDEPARLTEAVRRCSASSLIVVTDANVKAARGAAIAAAIERVGLPWREVVLEPGERNKTLDAVSAVWDAALDARVDRNALVVAAGGGVVGDLAGFAAACLLRGVRFVQAPTTLLSMVDSSVGGKTGFDHRTGKNLIGAFHQPSAVVADLAHLSTLSARERAAGLAEVVKIALATDEKLLSQVEAQAPALARGDVEALRPIVRAAIDAKIRIVRDDERESGPRALLNLGHTIGHALEGHGGFDRWLHGEAVALGTVIEMRATAAMGLTPKDLVERSAALLAALGLPSSVDAAEVQAAWPFVGSDKKRGGSTLALPIVTRAGESHVKRVPLTALRDAVFAGG
jgi:shikimate kinase/3-dehydroquinate synthase